MTTEQTQQPEQSSAPSLQLADLVLALKIIQAVAQRGAIRAEEMTEVGTLHDKLVVFLTSAGAITPAQAQPTQGETN
jgi:hypothetical protein